MTATIASPKPVNGFIKKARIESLDLLRGIVIIIMALDHVRDYFNADAYLYDATDLSKTNTLLFLTRWITHFCAPVFTFLAGASAFLNGTKKTKKELSFFLLTRGLWLVVLEITVVTFGWTFNAHFDVLIFQVIWSTGISMVVLAALIYLPLWTIGIIGLVLVAGHNLLDGTHVQGDTAGAITWSFLHEYHFFIFKNITIAVGYPLLPWIGIMALGYCFGTLYAPGYDAGKRKRALIRLGLGAIALFIVVRIINIYGDPHPEVAQPNALFTFFSFINVTKYPPSLDYTLLTLGPAILLLAFLEKPLNAVTKKIVVFGRVPMFFYLLHIYIIHLLAMGAAVLTGYAWHTMVLNTWVTNNVKLQGYGFGLGVVYLLWAVIVAGLYPLCKRYSDYKKTNPQKWWLSYL